MQTFLLQGLFAVVAVGIVLPVGLVGMFLLIRLSSVSGAVSHGELYVAGGNAALVGSVSLMAGRDDRPIDAAIAALFVVTLIVVPCYAFAAYFSVQTIVHERFSTEAATIGGATAASVGMVVGLAFVWLSCSVARPASSA